MSSTIARIFTAALSVITVVLLDAGVAHASTGLTVSLTVDDQTSQVTTTAATVAGLLSQQNVTVDSHDDITPKPTSALADGESVTVNHTQPVAVQRATATTTEYVTADTFDAAVVELGLYPRTYAARAGSFSAHRDHAFLTVAFRTPTGMPAVGKDPLLPNSVLQVKHVRLDYAVNRHRIVSATRRTRTPLIPAGHTVVVRRGRVGVRSVMRVTRLVDGHVLRRHLISSHVVRSASARVVQVGTGPNWYGLARCESGGNPNAVNAAGYYGLFQFSASTWHSVGGRGIPTNWGRREQTYRAWLLYKRRGAAPWPVCGRYL